MYSLLPCLVALSALFSSVVALPPSGTNPNPPAPRCLSPNIKCSSGACCPQHYTCNGGAGCSPIAGYIEVFYYTDAKGNQGMIGVNGFNFQSTAGLAIVINGGGIYDLENIAGPNWTVYTGVQDCPMDGATNGANEGGSGTVFANDDFLTNLYNYQTKSNSVAVQAMPWPNGLCPLPYRIIVPTLIPGPIPTYGL